MLQAAERLENGRAAEALPAQSRALGHLKDLQAALNRWRADDARERTAEALAVVRQARAETEKLAQEQAQVVDALRAVAAQADRSDKAAEETLEEIAAQQAQMSEAALKIANDLQVLPELPVGNELVEDITQVYEEMKQAAGSASNAVTELGLQKEDWILETLQAAAERLDDMEMWLSSEPDRIQRNTETFDLQEMPPIAVVPLPSELEDVIGDLLEQEERLRALADDSTGNQGSADLPAGWEIAEGEFTDYAAKGKSGNQRPEHKDQDGRSPVGREGMSDGEVVAATGKINEGDEDIERRMTRDPSQAGQVREEEHREARATGGGKLSGYGEGAGMSGPGPRRDAPTDAPSPLGWQALLRRNAEAAYAQATLRHLRTGRLDEAVDYLRQSERALAAGAPLSQVREFQRRAVAALRETQSDLNAGFCAEQPLEAAAGAAPDLGEGLAATPDEAPAQYRELVAEYFRALSEKR